MRKGLLITMVALAGCCSAAAQEPSVWAMNARVAYAATSAPKNRVRDSGPVRTPEGTRTIARATHHSFIESSYEFTETPFVQSVIVPVATFAGGRVQLGGFYRMLSAENFQMGLPGGGALPSWSVGMQNHAAVLAPRLDQGAGFNLSLHLHGAGLREMHCHAYQTVNRAIAFIRGS